MKKFKREENIIGQLVSIYESRGFNRYKPGCFEEYTLYQENKDFLIGKNVITFPGLGGKLLAMRPDVTLSLIRHTEPKEDEAEKFYYNEKVYRQTAGSDEFKEINQIGVEIVGEIDRVCEVELVSLICDTLGTVSDKYILDISHMGFTDGLAEAFGDSYTGILYELLKRKDLHDFFALAEREGFDGKAVKAFETAVRINGRADEALGAARAVVLNDKMGKAVDELAAVCAYLKKAGYAERVNLNFSIANNADYYNGIIFNGYIDGVPHRVLSGGRYDKLLQKFGKKGGAIGFALYLGEIERYFSEGQSAVDFLLLYDEKSGGKALDTAFELIKKGKTVRLSRRIPETLAYNGLIDLTGETNKNGADKND